MFVRFIVLLLSFSVLAFPNNAAVRPDQAGIRRSEIPSVNIEQVYPIRIPGGHLPEAGIYDAIDSNSPMHWDDNGNLYAFASVRHPFRSKGQNLYTLSPTTQRTVIQDSIGVEGGKWLEATWRDDDGMLYGWYHNEPPPMCSNDLHLTAPRIGAMISSDEGATWQDLGIVLEAPADSLNCQTQNYYFAGGNGDFSVMLDPNKEYFYFFFGTYHSQLEEQGISIARMKYTERKQPVGQIWKWRAGKWDEPGLGGKVTPIFPVVTNWHQADANAYWGPSIHFNTYLGKYVIVMNRALDGFWNQEGIYISYADNLSNPLGWTQPDRLPFDSLGMAYPQIVGIEKGGTDKLAGRSARLFLLGQSGWQITFDRSDDNDDGCDDCVGDKPNRTPTSPRQLPPSRQAPNRQMIRAARPSFLTIGLTDLDQAPRKKIEERPR